MLAGELRSFLPRLLIADGHLGIWAAMADVFPEVAEQRWLEPQDPQRPRPAPPAATGQGPRATGSG